MRVAKFAGSLFLIALPISGHAQDAAARTELVPTGTLRVGVAEAPTPGVLFVRRGADGNPQGVTVDLAQDLAQSVGVPVAFTVFPNTGEITEATNAGLIDVTFMPIDEARRQKVDFGPGYYNLESTYLVTEASGASDVGGVDRPGMRVVGIAGSTTLRASARTLKSTQPVPVSTVAEASERLRTGQADALALARDQLRPVQPLVPSSRVVTGSFQQTLIAVAVPKGRAAALAYVSDWLNSAKRSGLVRRIFDAQGLKEDGVTP
jgi:polar amino acid transport system substrate-binding protein